VEKKRGRKADHHLPPLVAAVTPPWGKWELEEMGDYGSALFHYVVQ